MLRKIALTGALMCSVAVPSATLAWGHGFGGHGGFGGGSGHMGGFGGFGGGFARWAELGGFGGGFAHPGLRGGAWGHPGFGGNWPTRVGRLQSSRLLGSPRLGWRGLSLLQTRRLPRLQRMLSSPTNLDRMGVDADVGERVRLSGLRRLGRIGL